MPASTAPQATVFGAVVFDEPVALPSRLEGYVDLSSPDPGAWTTTPTATLELRGLFDLWRSAFMEVVAVGASEDVRALQVLLCAAGRRVDLHAGWLDQAAAVATAEHAMSVIPTDSDLFAVAERLGRLAERAAARHRGVTFTVSDVTPARLL